MSLFEADPTAVGDDPGPMPPAFSSMVRVVKLGYRAEPRLLLASFAMTLLQALPDALVALWLALITNGLVHHDLTRLLVGAFGLAASATLMWALQVTLTRAIRRLGDPAAIRAFVEDVRETLLDAHGVGIAAPSGLRAVRGSSSSPRGRMPATRMPRCMEPVVVINPEILERSDDLVKGWEGCLSIPGIRGFVPRHRRIAVRLPASTARRSRRPSTTSLPGSSSTRYDHSLRDPCSSIGSRARGT